MVDPKNVVVDGVRMTPLTPQGATRVQKTLSDDISVSCYDNEVPDFVESELERLYGHVFSSLRHFKAYGGVPAHTSTFVARRSNRIVAIFLFLREDSRVRVLNEGMPLDKETLACFARHVFATYRSVSVISFHAVPTDIGGLAFPHQRHTCSEDIVAVIPPSREAYLASLGKATRSYIHRYENKLRRSFPSFRIEVYESANVREDDIRAIVQMNRDRMAAKAKRSSNDDEETARIIALARDCGVVCVATIDDRICAGVIHYRIGDQFFMPVIAHDARYNDYRIGTICCFLSICECIARGCREYHFMWGKYDYKYRLGGIQRDLDHVVVYRSPTHLFLNAGTAIRAAIAGHTRRTREWLHDQVRNQGQDGLVSRMVYNLVNDLRKLKRWTARRES